MTADPPPPAVLRKRAGSVLVRVAYGWAMVVALLMLSFLPLGSPAPEDWGAMVRLGLIAVGSAVLLSTSTRWQPLRRPLAVALGGYALLLGIELLATALSFGMDQTGPAMLSFLLVGTLHVALIAGAVRVWREAPVART